MQNKKARKSAREVNLFIDPTLKEDGDYVNKNGNRLPKRMRDFSRVVERIDTELRRVDPSMPKDVSPIHYLSIKKAIDVAYRENIMKKEISCPKCREAFEVDYPNVKAEANSIAALNILFDRMYAKLGHLTQEINLTGYMNVITEHIVKIVVKYVPLEKKPEAMASVSELFERLIENEAGTGVFNKTQDETNRLLESIA